MYNLYVLGHYLLDLCQLVQWEEQRYGVSCSSDQLLSFSACNLYFSRDFVAGFTLQPAAVLIPSSPRARLSKNPKMHLVAKLDGAAGYSGDIFVDIVLQLETERKIGRVWFNS